MDKAEAECQEKVREDPCLGGHTKKILTIQVTDDRIGDSPYLFPCVMDTGSGERSRSCTASCVYEALGKAVCTGMVQEVRIKVATCNKLIDMGQERCSEKHARSVRVKGVGGIMQQANHFYNLINIINVLRA